MSAPTKSILQKRCRHQHGFTLVTAVFLIAILGLLSAYMVSLRTRQDAAVTLDTLGTRAYAAARSGIEWGAYNSLRNNLCAASTSVAFGGTLGGYTVTVTCSRTAFNEGGVAVNVDAITSTACNSAVCPQAAPAPNYVERQISVMVSR